MIGDALAWFGGRPVRFAAIALAVVCAACAPSASWPAASNPASAPEPTVLVSPPALIRPADSWIEVDLDRQMVLLHEGVRVLGSYAASSGVASNPTPPGLYRVQMMEKGPVENVPGVFVSNIVIFDLGQGNGIHSLPMDADGNMLDNALGAPATAGCVRVGESARVFEFARIGMRVWIH